MSNSPQYVSDGILYPSGSVIMAPLSGYTDLPYRHSLRRHGCYYAFTEMIDAGSLSHRNGQTRDLLARGEDEPWLGVQLVGVEPEWLAVSVEALNRYHFDVLDFNLGCPVPKIVKKGAGAALGTNPDEAARRLEILVRKSRFPVTAKTRILDEQNPEPTVQLVRKLEAAGARTVTLHGRLRSAYYSGPVYSQIIAAVREAVKIPVIANGGVVDGNSAERLRQESGCDAIMIARGAMGNPWLFQELLHPDTYRPPTPEELGAEIRLHIEEMIAFYGEERALRMARKILHDYLKGRGYPHAWKAEISYLDSRAKLSDLIRRIQDGPVSGNHQ